MTLANLSGLCGSTFLAFNVTLYSVFFDLNPLSDWGDVCKHFRCAFSCFRSLSFFFTQTFLWDEMFCLYFRFDSRHCFLRLSDSALVLGFDFSVTTDEVVGT